MPYYLIIACALLLLQSMPVQAQAAVGGHEIDYQADGQTMKGYLAYDDSIKGKRPGVIVVHEWWGVNDYARHRANMLARLGYVALAVDMYGDGRLAANPADAAKFSRQVSGNMAVARQRFAAGMRVLREHPSVDSSRIAAIGYCFGGGIVLQMARQGLDLKGVVSFHGSLRTENPARPGKVKARILVCNGGADKLSSMEDITGFIKEMVHAGVDFEFHSFPGALHSFTNPAADLLAKKFNLPIGYQKKADEESWREMQDFLKAVFDE